MSRHDELLAVIAEGRRLEKAATNAPWFAREDDMIGGTCVVPVDLPPSESRLPEVANSTQPADAELMAWMRNYLPLLLGAVELMTERGMS